MMKGWSAPISRKSLSFVSDVELECGEVGGAVASYQSRTLDVNGLPLSSLRWALRMEFINAGGAPWSALGLGPKIALTMLSWFNGWPASAKQFEIEAAQQSSIVS